jgi:hypothetical protein
MLAIVAQWLSYLLRTNKEVIFPSMGTANGERAVAGFRKVDTGH